MTEKNQPLDSQISSASSNHPEQPPHRTLDDEYSLLNFPAFPASTPAYQKVDITFANGHRFCLEGSFDWDIVSTWLTPLLTQE